MVEKRLDELLAGVRVFFLHVVSCSFMFRLKDVKDEEILAWADDLIEEAS